MDAAKIFKNGSSTARSTNVSIETSRDEKKQNDTILKHLPNIVWMVPKVFYSKHLSERTNVERISHRNEDVFG